MKLARQVIEPFNLQPMDAYTQYFQQYTLDVEGPSYIRTYTYFWAGPDMPKNSSEKFPLVMVLHGTSGNGYAAKYLVSSPLAEKHPSFVFVPVLGEGNSWALLPENGTPAPEKLGDNYALGDMVRMITHLEDIYPIDRSRIYVVGCSSGGTGVWAVAHYYPDFFAAGLVASGLWSPADAPNLTRMPLWVENGALDPIASAASASELVQLINSYKGNATYTEFPDMSHNCPSGELYSDTVWDWLFKQRLSGR